MTSNVPIDELRREIFEVVRRRGILQVVHFTTNSGLLGAAASRAIKSRRLLDQDQYVKHIFQANAEVRKDPAWTGYVNLSVSDVNRGFFSTSDAWHRHRDLWWAVLVLDVEVLAHPGVVFSTTNNIWPARRRGEGARGLEAMFAERVEARFGTVRTREGLPEHLPTCEYAEVLYPEQVDIKWLKAVIVSHDEHAAVAEAQLRTLNLTTPVSVEPDIFRRERA